MGGKWRGCRKSYRGVGHDEGVTINEYYQSYPRLVFCYDAPDEGEGEQCFGE